MINSTLTAPSQRVKLSCGGDSFICLHSNLKKLGLFLQTSTSFHIFDFASTFYFINNMPRIKQSPRKNPRDLPNPTNWASILRNNHHKYFCLSFCDLMRRDGCILRSDRCILQRNGYKLLILKIFIFYSIL